MSLVEELDRERCRYESQIKRLNKRVQELEQGMLFIKRWIDTGQFDEQACRTWIILYLG